MMEAGWKSFITSRMGDSWRDSRTAEVHRQTSIPQPRNSNHAIGKPVLFQIHVALEIRTVMRTKLLRLTGGIFTNERIKNFSEGTISVSSFFYLWLVVNSHSSKSIRPKYPLHASFHRRLSSSIWLPLSFSLSDISVSVCPWFGSHIVL